MELPNCGRCRNTPCICGWKYRNWSIEKIQAHVDMLTKILMFKKQTSNLEFSEFSSDAVTEHDKQLMEYIGIPKRKSDN